MLKYKDYIGVVEFDEDSDYFHGEVIDTRDVITFQGRNVNELREAFKESIDDYLEFCKERRESPEKPFSGKFMLRITPEEHKEAYIEAKREQKSLNEWVKDAVNEKIHKAAH